MKCRYLVDEMHLLSHGGGEGEGIKMVSANV